MKATEKIFLRFLEGSDKHFVIPVYQRNYDWKKEHCKQLFDDLIDVTKNDFRTHFLGSIVSIYHDDGEDLEYLIIDGQQRITTLSLLLLAIYKIIDKKLLQSKIINKKQIKTTYLINEYSKDDKKIRLKPVKDDKKAFSKLFGQEEHYILDSNITVNFQYFYNRIQEQEISIDDLFSAIKKLIIVGIELKRDEDDPQLIFESLNSTGLDLTEADKVRNFVLMNEDTKTQDRFYEDYWRKLEKNTEFNVSDFIRNYLTLKERKIPNKNKVYFSFKKYAGDNNTDTEILLKDMLKFSEYYKKIAFSKDERPDVNEILNRINKLEIVVSYPFLLEVFDYCANDIITKDDLKRILKIIESFIFRRGICNVPTNSLNKIFMILGREIKKYQNYENNYVEILKYVLINKKASQRFPDNNDFERDIVSQDIYNFKSKNREYLLERLENYDNKEPVKDDELTIEHIMPQTLTSNWKKMLGDNWEQVHEEYLHTLGNITLTGYNEKYSNRSFIEKRDMKKGFKESRLFLNKYLQTLEQWNEEKIKERAEMLKNIALKIWEYPTTNYKPQKDEAKLFTLGDEDSNLTGERIESFIFMDDKERNVKTWKEFYEQIALILYDRDQVKFMHLLNDKKFDKYLADDGNRLRNPVKIAEQLFLETNFSSESILSAMRIFVKEFELYPTDISFYIK